MPTSTKRRFCALLPMRHLTTPCILRCRQRQQVEELIQGSRQYRTDDKVNWEISALKEAFARLQVGGGQGGLAVIVVKY